MAMKEEVMASDSEEEMPTLVHYNNGFAGLDEEDEQEDEDMAQVVVTNPGGNGASSEDLGVADVLESDEGTSATASDDENGDRSQHHRRRRVMSLEEQIDDFIRSYENVPPPPPDRRTKLDPSLVHPEVMKQLLGCRICKRILDRPVRVAGCCHRFCASCFQRHYSTSKRCPTCFAKIEETNGELAAPCPHYATLVEVFFADARPEVVFSQPEHLALRKRSASRTAHATNGDEMRGGRSPRGSSDTDSSSDGVNEVVNLSDITDSSADDDPPSEELGSWRHISQDSLDFPPLESLLEKEMRLPLNGSIVPRSEMSELSKKVEKRQRKISKFVLRRNLEQKVKGDPDEAGPSSSPKDVTPPPSSARHRRRNRIVFKQTESPFPRPSHETSGDSRRYRDYDDDEDEDDDYPDDPSPSNVRTLRRRDHNGVTHSENSEASGRRRAGGAAPSIMQPLRKKQRGDEGEEMPPALLSTANHQDEQSENSGADGDDECEMDDLPSLGRESRYSPAPVYHRLDRSFMNPVIVWPDMHVHNSLIDKDFLLQRFFLLPNEAQIGHLCQAILERLGREHQLKDVDTLLTCRILPVLEEFLIGDLLILDVSSQRAAQALEPVSVVGDTATASASGLQTVNPVSVSLISDDSDSLSSRASTPHTPPPRAANPNSTFITVRYPHEPLNPDTTIEDVVAKYSKANFIPGVLKLVYSITDLVPLT